MEDDITDHAIAHVCVAERSLVRHWPTK